MPYKTILIDDEPISINRIKRLLKEYDDTFEIIGEALNGQEGLEMIEDLRPDLIFLDEFNYSDFILLYPFLEKRKLVILQTKFPMYYHPNVPPLNTYAFPIPSLISNYCDIT